MAARLTCHNDRWRWPNLARYGRCALLVLCLASIGTALQAGSGTVIHLPMGNTKPKNGLKVVVDFRWLDGNGYRPVRVDMINWPPGPTRADRTIRLVLEPQLYSWNRTPQRATQYIEIPQGTSRVSTTIAVPQHFVWRNINISVHEDGELCEDLSREVGISNPVDDWSEANPAILIIDSDAPTPDDRQRMIGLVRGKTDGGPRRLPDIRFLSEFFPSIPAFRDSISPSDDGFDDNMTIASLQVLSKVDLLPPTELPERWIDYSCCDMIFVSFADLKTLAVQHRARWQAIRQWLASGPTL